MRQTKSTIQNPPEPRAPHLPQSRRSGKRRPRHRRHAARSVRSRPGHDFHAERVDQDRQRQHRHHLLGALGDGPGRLHRDAHAGGRGTRSRPQQDQGRDRARRRGLHQHAARRPAHRRLDFGGRRLRQAAHRRRAGAHDARIRRRAEVGRGRVEMLGAARFRFWSQGRPRKLRPTRRSRVQAAGAEGAQAQGREELPLRGQVGQAPGHAVQGQRHGGIRHRRQASRHALRLARAVPGDRRQGGELRRLEGEGDAGREARGADHRRRCRGGRYLVAGEDRARRARHHLGRRSRQRR